MSIRRWGFALCVLATCFVAFVGTLSGCSSEPLMSAEAEPVPYEPSGVYTTTFTPRQGISMDDLTAADLQVGYPIIDPAWIEEQENAAPESTAGATEESESSEEVPTVTAYAEVKAFSVNDDGTATLTFEDPKAAENQPAVYSVYAEKTEFSSQVPVNYPRFDLEPDISYVPATAETTKLTLVLNDGEFNPGITKDAITLGGSFMNMAVESLSSAGKNLTLQLTGMPTVVPETGVYVPGTVGVVPEAIAHASVTTHVSVPVQTDGVMIEPASLKASDGNITVPVLVFGVSDPASITTDQVSITGGPTTVTVRDVQVERDNQAVLTLDMPGVTTANEAAKALTGQTLKVTDLETTVDLPEASFYPVFDYVDEDGDDLVLTLISYANGGTFAEDLAVDDVTLADAFKDGTVKSVERTGDTTATIELAIPSNGMKPEDLDITGTVTLASGSLISAWGEPTDGEASYTRSYSQESLGRDVPLTDVLKTVENSGFMSALNIAGSVSSGYDAVMNLLSICGLTQDANQQILNELKDIEHTLDDVNEALAVQTELMKDLQKTVYQDRLNGFDSAMYSLADDNQTAADYFAMADTLGVKSPTQVQEETASVQTVPEEATTQMPQQEEAQAIDERTEATAERTETPEDTENPDSTETPEDAETTEIPTFTKTPEAPAPTVVPEADNPYAGMNDDQAWSKYLTDLLQAMRSAEASGNGNFIGFTKTMQTLESDFRTVASKVGASTDSNNALYNYDYLCSLTYNFDTIANPYRRAFRGNIEYQLGRALGFLSAYYNSYANPNNPSMNSIKRYYADAQNQLTQRAVKKYNMSMNIYFYLAGCYVSPDITAKDGTWIYRETSRAIDGWGDLSSTEGNNQVEEFAKRMSGRTAREEIVLAGFPTKQTVHYQKDGQWQEDTTSIDDLVGLGLNFYVELEDRGTFYNDYHHQYADIIKWDETTVTYRYERSRYRYQHGNHFLKEDGYDIINQSPSAFRYAASAE